MKPYCIAAITLLLFAFCSLTDGQNSHRPEKCCFKFIRTKIPVRVVVRVETTSPACKDSGVIFHTTGQRQICASPEQHWVLKLMTIVQNRMKDAASVAGSGDSAAP